MARRLRKTVPKERLSRSEWEIMRVCRRLGRCTVREVLEEDRHRPKRDYRTILTFMSRMANKGWLRAEKEGNTNYFTPAIAEKAAMAREIRRFLTEVVGQRPENRQLVEEMLKRR